MKPSVGLLVLFFSTVLAVAQSPPAAQDSATPAVLGRVHLVPGDASLIVERKVPAIYPENARTSGVQGTVVLNVLITENGEVKEATAVSGDPALAQAAIESIKQWKYKPYTIDGKPQEVETQASFSFHIKAPAVPPAPVPSNHGKCQIADFGISYHLPLEWVGETNHIRQQVASSEGEQQASQVLLAALHVPVRSDADAADSSLVLTATPPLSSSEQGEAKDYLIALAASLSSRKKAKQIGEITQLEFGGVTLYRADFRPSEGDAQYQAVVCTVAKSYLLRWNFLALSRSVLDEAVATLGVITKAELIPTSATPSSSPDKEAPSPNPPTALPSRMRVSSGVTAGLLVKKVEPRYPQAAKAAHIQGTVVLHAVIDKMGNILGLEVVSGPIELVPSAARAVRQWKYTPYLLKGEPIELDTTIEIHYQLG